MQNMCSNQPKPKNNKYVVMLLSSVILASGLFIITNLFSIDIKNIQAAVATACYDSSLWNETDGFISDRVTDFSRAGYMAGEEAIPNDPAQYNIKSDFGAKGDGTTNDTKAFQNAVAQVTGVIFIPEGEYVITEPIRILNDGVVLRGAGRGKTSLIIPVSLNEYCSKGNNWTEVQTCVDASEANNTFGNDNAFIQFGDDTKAELIGDPKEIPVQQNAKRGEHNLVIEYIDRFKAGQWVVLQMVNKPLAEFSLMNRLQGGNPYGADNSLLDGKVVRFINKIERVQQSPDTNETTLTFVLPLTIDVQTDWDPTISGIKPSVTNVGIENLRIIFPFTEYLDHTHVAGYNAIQFNSATNCWANNIAIHNSDNGIKTVRSAFCTLSNIRFDDSFLFNDDKGTARKLVQSIKARSKAINADPNTVRLDKVPKAWLDKKIIRGPYSGYHGFSVSKSYFILVTNSEIKNRPSLALSTNSFANMNVFSKISGFDLTLDHHRRSPHNNLYTEIDAGVGWNVWKSDGLHHGIGPHSGAYNTYWNIFRGENDDRPVRLPVGNEYFDKSGYEQDFGLKLNFVYNVNGSKKYAHRSWVVQDKKNLCTPNLYDAMVQYKEKVEREAIANGEDPELPSIF